MRRIYLLPVLFLLILSGCIKEYVSGSGAITSENRNLGGTFTSIQVKGSINVQLKQGDTTKVVVKDYENLLLYLETRLVGNTLIIEYNDAWINRSAGEVTLTVPRIADIDVSGSSDIGTIGNFNFTDLSINVSGSSGLFLAGTAKNLNVKISGSGDIRAFEMPSDSARITISGSGSGQLNVKKLLDVNISGSGDLIYKGDPSVSSRVTGSGRVRRF